MNYGDVMLQDIRDNSQGTIAKVIVGLIVVTFALFGAESLVGSLGGDPELAVVNGEEISQIEFAKAVDFKRRQIVNQMGGQFDPSLIDEERLQKLVREELISEKVLLLHADESSMAVSSPAIDQQIVNMPQFKEQGVFNNELFLNLIRNFGMTTQEFKFWLEKQFILTQQKNGFIGSGFVLQSELDEMMKIDRQTRDVAYSKIEANQLKDGIEVTDQEAKNYFDENKEMYKHPEKVDISYLLVDKAQIATEQEIADQEIADRYDANKLAFAEEEERDASHILLEVTEDRSEEATRTLLSEIKARIESGESFEALAKEFSDDIGSRMDGGKLGFAKKGVYDPAFEDALFSLAKDEVSGVVKTQFGLHLIKLHSIEVKPYSALDEVKGAIVQALKNDKAEEVYLDLSERLADISYSSSDLAEPSETLGLTIQKTSVSTEGTEGFLGDERIIQAAFSEDVKSDGNNSSAIELDGSKTLVLRVDNHYPERLYSFDEAKTLVKEAILNEKSASLAVTKGLAIVENPKLVDEGDWVVLEKMSRNDASLSRDIIKRVFELKKPVDAPVLSGLAVEGGDYYVLRVDSVSTSAADNLSDAEKGQARNVLASQMGNEDFLDFSESLKQRAEIEIN